MHVLLITDKFLPERGGSQNFFARLYEDLAGCRATILTREWPGDAETDRTYPQRIIRVPYSNVPKVRSPLLWLRLRQAATRLLRTEQIDQVHCGQSVETAPWGIPLARKWGKPGLVHTFAEDIATYSGHRVFGPLMLRALKDATAVTTVSTYTRDRLTRLGVPAERIHLLYPGVDPQPDPDPALLAQIRRAYELDGRALLLTVSRMIPRKGHETVLQALPSILKQVPDAVYLVVGGGPEQSRLQSLARELGVEAQVRFTGPLPDSEMFACYHAADAFVMPNRQMPDGDVEGFGMVFLEANACGKPAIGGRSGGAPDAIVDGETGYLVAPNSPEEVAARAVELLRDGEKRRRMGEAARERVGREFTWAQSRATLGAVVEALGIGH